MMSVVTHSPFHGAQIPTPRFADDRGDADPDLAQALERFASGEGTREDVHRVLASARLLVPVVAMLDEAEMGDHGQVRDKHSSMATVSMIGAGGRRALLAFTSVDSLKAWNADARPVPAIGADVCRAARDQGDDAVLLDVAGPVRIAITDDALRDLAATVE